MPVFKDNGNYSLISKKERRTNASLAYLFILPVMLILIVFTFYPFLKSLYLTFFLTDRIGHISKFQGLKNYERLFKSGELVESIYDTCKYAALLGVLTFSLAMVLAYMSTKKVKGSRIYQTLFSMPLAIATAPVAAVGTFIFGYYGMLNSINGTQIAFLSHPVYKWVALLVLTAWCNCGSSFIYILVGFRNVPDELIECAELDGANSIQKFFKIFLPIASPQIFYVVFLNILTAFKSFTMIQLLFGLNEDGMHVLNGQIYRVGIETSRFETACIYSLALCLLIFIVTRIQFALEKRMVNYQ